MNTTPEVFPIAKLEKKIYFLKPAKPSASSSPNGRKSASQQKQINFKFQRQRVPASYYPTYQHRPKLRYHKKLMKPYNIYNS